MVWNYLALLQGIGWDDLLDIGLAAALLWAALHVLRSTRMRGVGAGLLLFGVLFLGARQLGLELTVWMLQGITAAIVLVTVVVYQNEIRRLLERLPAAFLPRPSPSSRPFSGVAELLTEAAGELSGERRGALIILPGNDSLETVVSEGTTLDGSLSKALLLSLFDPNSPGHDGALILRDGRVERFGTRLPLSEQEEQLRERGTRHAAALGLAEKTDALVLVVSEESGRISLARHGRLRTVADSRVLWDELAAFLQGRERPGQEERAFPWRAGLEATAALVLAAGLWLVLVPGSVVATVTFEVPIEVQNIPEGYVLAEVAPSRVAVTLSGEKRHLFQVVSGELAIRLDGTLTRFGRRTFPITPAHLLLPPGVAIADLVPEQAKVSVRKLE